MAYRGSRGRSGIGQIAGQLVLYVTVFLIVFFGTPHLRDFHGPADFTLYVLSFAGWLLVAIVMHECGHLVVGLAAGEPVRKILIGAGPTIIGFRVRGLAVQICLNVLAGGAVFISRVGSASTARLVTVAAGPAVNLIAALYGFILFRSGVEWLGGFVLVNALVLITAVIPVTLEQDGAVLQSDGMQIWNYFFRRGPAFSGFEGSLMRRDAYAVIARATEDAALAGASEVTDIDLLRALSLDARVGPLFATSGLTPKIPQVAIAESDQRTPPVASKTFDAAITAAVRRCRDMGIPKPDAASFALGLVLTDCPAAKLLAEVGVTEQSLLKVITSRPDDAEDAQPAGVVSPDLPLERWGTAADHIMAEAYRIAAVDRAAYVGSEHLLAAIVRTPDCRGAQALTRLRFNLTWNPTSRTSEAEAPEGMALLSPQGGLALAGALWRTGSSQPTGTAEVLLGIVDQRAGVGAQILLSAGVGTRQLESAIRQSPRDKSEPCGCTPASRSLWMLRGSARIGAERWLAARSDFIAAESASTTEGLRALCQNNVAWASLMSGDPALFAESLERSRAAVAFKPDQISFQGTHAFALLESGLPADAAKILEEVIPKHGRPRSRASDLCLLAICRLRMGEPDQAARHIDEASAADPKCPLLARARAEAEKVRVGAI